MNAHDKLKIARKLMENDGLELTGEELQAMLDAELEKPEQEVDAQLAEALLTLLEDDVEVEARTRAWEALRSRLTPARCHPVLTGMMRFAAAFVVLSLLFLTAWQTANAFNPDFFRKLVKPLSEHFVIYSGNAAAPELPEETAPPQAQPTVVLISSPEEAPSDLLGYPALPPVIPERFSYLQGEVYCDDNISSVTHFYGSGSETFVFTVTVLTDASVTSSGLYEKTPDNVRERYICGVPVLFYTNQHNGNLPATAWALNMAQYGILGDLSEEELIFMIESTINSFDMEE